MRRWLVLIFLLCLLAIQASLNNRLNFSLDLVLIFLLYLLFYQFRYSLEFFLLAGWLIDIDSHLFFGIFVLIFWLLFLIMRYLGQKLKQSGWRQKFVFLLSGLLVYNLLVSSLAIFNQFALTFDSAIFLMKGYLISLAMGCFLWYLFDYLKSKFWSQA